MQKVQLRFQERYCDYLRMYKKCVTQTCHSISARLISHGNVTEKILEYRLYQLPCQISLYDTVLPCVLLRWEMKFIPKLLLTSLFSGFPRWMTLWKKQHSESICWEMLLKSIDKGNRDLLHISQQHFSSLSLLKAFWRPALLLQNAHRYCYASLDKFQCATYCYHDVEFYSVFYK